ncbi:hypothetical protein ES288_D05G106900v1 [Gossypium darwinii]|uniref:RING-type domain-containing protein n=1 Tax=Gossypium darwinii TaxID=34276 RepID=A0A5D2CIS4_GOSDA|nr:hypothetical protein ES288_D05G106900v1 [Gossypium darwinii]TYG67837.1 hypothetical protein ES288_D05G106900v1 [Gossypium darwinii]
MSDEGEKTCPLCAEEMDLTDQQLKPCKCGYEICVWCWHHIMEMAEKDETEGKCPACRCAYDKDRIVGMAANCERLVAEINSERKSKSTKAKTKSSEGRRQLSSVRVIQRNLVYIVGLPLNLGDEDLLQQREYFGQYGKVLKVSMSRTATGVIQQFPNNTCSVYITYSKEEEAIRCIRSIHGFVLEGRPLKACFGTTKYCHAWLRNVPCNNPDCLYLHEIGSQEDSFTKDEIISAYTRVQQITGATNNMLWPAGNMLPPPVDDYCPTPSYASAGKPISKNAPNNTTVCIPKGSPPNGSTGRSVALPAGASWGMRALNHPQTAGLASSNGPSKQKSDTVRSALPFSSAVTNTNQNYPVHGDVIKKSSEEIHDMQMKGKQQNADLDCQTTVLEKQTTLGGVSASKSLSCELSCPPVFNHYEQGSNMPSTVTNSTFCHAEQSFISSSEKPGCTGSTDGKIHSLCSDMQKLTVDRNVYGGPSNVLRPSSADSDHGSSGSPSSLCLQQCYTEDYREPLSSLAIGRTVTSPSGFCVSKQQSDWINDRQTQPVANRSSDVEEDILSFDNQRLNDPKVISRSSYVPNSPISLHLSNQSRPHWFQRGAVNLDADAFNVDNKVSDSLHLHGSSVSSLSNGYPEKYISSSIGSDITVDGSHLLPSEGKGKQIGRFLDYVEGNDAKETGESSIISNILSLDFDTWDESLASPHNLAKLLCDTVKQPNTLKLSTSWKAPNNGQSRFSFARQEDSKYHPFDMESSFSLFGQMPQNPSSQEFAESTDLYQNKFGISNGFSSHHFAESDYAISGPSVFSSNKLSAVSRPQISAPPGFSVPSRTPPPGFSHERIDHAYDTTSGNHLMDCSSLLRNSYQALASGGIGGPGDIEFMDPAILAVGKGRLQGALNSSGLDMRSNFPPQLDPYEDEARFQLLMQRSLSPNQNMRYDGGDSSPYFEGISSGLMDQSQVNKISPFAQLSLPQSRNTNGHWDGWNEVEGGNGIGVAELLQNQRLGFNKFYSGYEDSNKYRMPTSGDLYSRTFGM